jgi:mannose-1-phosphate guanylyltransferase
MRALLLAGGLGTRLQPLTNSIPKCLVPINGKPILEIWLERLTLASMGPFLINTHYLAHQVEAFISSSPFQKHSRLVHELELRGTGGTLIDNLNFFGDEDGMVLHVDNYCMADLTSFVQAHMNRPPECIMTMMTFRTNSPSSCGIVELDEQGVVIGFHEKQPNPPGNLANGAVYIFSPELFKIIIMQFHYIQDLSTELIPNLLGKIFSYETNNIFIDIGTICNYAMANEYSGHKDAK